MLLKNLCPASRISRPSRNEKFAGGIAGREGGDEMSVFGGDSWGREAHHRKRRVDDLMSDSCSGATSSSASYKRLSSGKYACLVCPNNPVLDSPLMLSMHSQGARHAAAAARLKERELLRQEEIMKRMALSVDTGSSTLSATRGYFEKPLIEHTKRAILGNASRKCHGEPCSREKLPCADTKSGTTFKVNEELHISAGIEHNSGTSDCDILQLQQLEGFKKLREKEIKFIEAGWRRDCHGKWFRDENVEFDSDEEDPNNYAW